MAAEKRKFGAGTMAKWQHRAAQLRVEVSHFRRPSSVMQIQAMLRPFAQTTERHTPPNAARDPTYEKSSPFSSMLSFTRSRIVVFHLSSFDI